MLRNEILELMDTLKLRGMHAVFDEVLTKGRKKRSSIEKILQELLLDIPWHQHRRESMVPLNLFLDLVKEER